MTRAKRIAVFPEPGAIGPAMNLIGICQGLREAGHEPVFILEPGLAGTASEYGFEEHQLSCMPPMSPEEQARYWDDFMVRYLPTFRTSPLEQISTYVKACWEAIVDTSKWSVKNGLADVLANIEPDLIINDNVALYPDTERAGCPWVRMISCSENEIADPDLPPHLSGCRAGDHEAYRRFRDEFTHHIRPVHEEFMQFLRGEGVAPLPFPEFVLPSPHLNLLLYPKPLRFARRNPLDQNKFVYLDGCVREEDQTYELPAFKCGGDDPVIYFSFGSLGVADVDLIKRMIRVLAKAPYRVLVNVGDYEAEYQELPDNVVISSWFKQTAVLPHVDVFITHGGNNSFNEALYFGVPPLVMPFVWDGHDNAQRVNDTTHGIGMPRYEWRDEELLANLEALLNDKTIRENIDATSRYMRAHDGRKTATAAINGLLNRL